MLNLSASTTINRPVELVFDKLANDFEHTYPQYASLNFSIEKITEGPVAVGSRFIEKAPKYGRQEVNFKKKGEGKRIELGPLEPDLQREIIEQVIEVTGYDLNRSFSIKMSQPEGTGFLVFKFKKAGEGTALTLLAQLNLTGSKPLQRFIYRLLLALFGPKSFKEMLEKIKGLVEAA
ncbi:MAG TPA: hypothetical protein VH186_16780 [Chloroflexia bacterium]|nr:hypothetical protein [Chloroflexia bacterium]